MIPDWIAGHLNRRYAFVIHTRSPLPGASPDAALVELCVGLGESLVSNSPGRALSASVEGSRCQVWSYITESRFGHSVFVSWYLSGSIQEEVAIPTSRAFCISETWQFLQTQSYAQKIHDLVDVGSLQV